MINVADRAKRKAMQEEIRTLMHEQDKPQPGLVSFFGAFFTADSHQISIVLEYCDCGSLSDVVAKAGKLPLPVLARMTLQVVEGLAHLHGVRRMVHRDIKASALERAL